MNFTKFSLLIFLFSFSLLVQCSARYPDPYGQPVVENSFVNIDFTKSPSGGNVPGFSSVPLKIRYFTKCGDSSEVETQVPEKVELGDLVQLSSNYNINKCNSDKSLLKQTIKLKSTPQGIMVEIHVESACDCHMPGEEEYNYAIEEPCQKDPTSDTCGGNGVCLNDHCDCYPGFFGNFCMNSFDELEEDYCRLPGETLLCSGNGACRSGVCFCYVSFSGQYCEIVVEEISENICRYNEYDEVCSGNGICTDGSCSCYAGYTGKFCGDVKQEILEHRCSYLGERPLCSGKGYCTEGSCTCNAGFSGRYCEIDLDERFCKFDENSSVCSGQGNCVNGECQCDAQGRDRNEVISGQYCECTNFNCYKFNGSICGNNGKCECNRCICDEGWTGESCEISCSTISIEGCLNEDTGDICSWKGECKCGECSCRDKYYGKWCQNTNMEAYHCPNLRDCAECKGFSSGRYSAEECELQCSAIKWNVVGDMMTDEYYSLCHSFDSNHCKFVYSYTYNEDRQMQAYVQTRKYCPSMAHPSFYPREYY